MKIRIAVAALFVLALSAFIMFAQESASVKIEKHADAIRAGGPVAFDVKLNEPLPTGAYFQLRISPVSVDQQIPINSGEPIDAERKTFRVTGTLPQAAIPGKWHISVIYLFLAGTSWTSNTIKPNDLTFDVEGKAFAIPTTADISLAK